MMGIEVVALILILVLIGVEGCMVGELQQRSRDTQEQLESLQEHVDRLWERIHEHQGY